MVQKKKPAIEKAAWWAITDKEIWAALEAEAALPRSQSDRRWLASLSAEDVWRRSPWWVYDHWEWFDQKKIGTGITASMLMTSIARCTTRHDTRKDLAWSRLRPGTREYIEWVKKAGLSSVREIQGAFIAGDTDSQGNWWCGLCFHRYEAMQAGQRCDFQCAKDFYAVSPKQAVGPEGWLALMQECSIVHAATLARQVDQAISSSSSSSILSNASIR